MNVRAEVRLPVRPEEAWRRLLMWERQPEWMVDAAQVRVLGHRREGTGVRVAVKTRIFGIPAFTEILEVQEWEPPQRLTMAHGGPVRGVGEWWLQPDPDGTLFRWIEDVRLPIPVLGILAMAAYSPVMRRLMRRSVENFRRLVA